MGSRCPVASVVAEAGSSAGGGNLLCGRSERVPPSPCGSALGGLARDPSPPPAIAHPRGVPAVGDARRGEGWLGVQCEPPKTQTTQDMKSTGRTGQKRPRS